MRDPYWHDATSALYAADPREILAEMPDQTVDCIVTSPPPWLPARDDQAHDDYGHEPTPTLYVAAVRRVLAEAHRVLADTGTCWLITSDRYATDTGRNGPPSGRHTRRISDQAMTGLPASSLIGLPWQIGFALQDDGWIIRNAIVWHHPTTETEPVADRCTRNYELILLLVKQEQYHFELDPLLQLPHPEDAARPPGTSGNQGSADRRGTTGRHRHDKRHIERHGNGTYANAAGNCRRHGTASLPPGSQPAAAMPSGNQSGDVWTLPASPFWNTMPTEVPLRCIAAGCRPGGTVLDMFAGIATTGLAARELDHPFIGVEKTPSLCEIARRRLLDDTDTDTGDGDAR